MNEQRYNVEDLQEYTGILTHHSQYNERFKMELKVEDNPVLKERWTEKNESSIELEFRYNGGPSTMFFHNGHTCERIECPECERMRKRYDIFHANLHHLQLGDTFSTQAALINNKQSVLPAEIHSFENYQPLLAACTEYWLRLPDTDEGVAKKQEIIDRRLKAEQDAEEQRLQQEREAEEKRKEDEEQAQKDAKTRKRNESIQQFFGKRPNLNQIIITAVGTTIANQIPLVFKGLKYIYRLIFPN